MNARQLALELLSLVKGQDSYTTERRRTSRFRRHWRADGPLKCAVCGGVDPSVPVDAAHLLALEENGTTVEENLLPLCSTSLDGRRRNAGFWLQRLLDQYEGQGISLQSAAQVHGIRMGCHELLDYGLVSKETLADPTTRTSLVRTQALAKALDGAGGEFGVRSKGSKVTEARTKVSNAKTLPDLLVAECALISLLRRTGDAGVREALDRCRGLVGAIGDDSSAPRSRFYYEFALALQVGERQQGLRETKAYLAKSKGAATPDSGSWGMSEIELVHAEVLSAHPKTVGRHVQSWMQRQDVGLVSIDQDSKLNAHNKARWRMNYLMHRSRMLAKVAVAQRRPDTAKVREALERAWRYRNGITAEAGWTRFQSVHLVTLEGIVLHLEGKYVEALACLARALRPMTTGRGKRPEGVSDIAYCMSRCFRAIGRESAARKADTLAREVLDQRSGVLWPQS